MTAKQSQSVEPNIADLANGIVENKTERNEPNYKNINSYAVNGAVHYADALLHFTGYDEIIAVGMTGWKDAGGALRHKIGMHYVSKLNNGYGQEIGSYDDFSFLSREHFDEFLQKIEESKLSPEEAERFRS